MGNQRFVWQDRYNLGVEVIDKEHRRLFTIMNKLFAYGDDEEKSQWAYQEGVKFFKGHAVKHFAEEEAYMQSIGYEGYKTHKHLHDVFRRETLPAIEKELEETEYSQEAVDHFLGVCAGWLIGHTLTEDRAIIGKSDSKWNDLLPAEQQAAMKEATLRMLNELFQLDAKVISESYSGERFGKGIYYRLIYGSDKGERWEFFLIFEEKLLVNTIGSLMGGESDHVNVMIMNATRYTARQFVERIMVHFPSDNQHDVKKENLLTFDQFEKAFEGRTPQCSMLLDTGEGYFAFCIMAPHLLEKTDAVSIQADNAMEEIEKYLSDNETPEKKKILIVDDSALVRQAMKQLFDKDYEVSLASSGMAAIRCLILDKPDLILLDYEMPVCDGKQVLEMIRAESEFAGIPVIFLTGSVDRERIKKILPLKPAGYLLKTLQPQEIKENIDGFFKKR